MDLTPANIRALRTSVHQDFRKAYDITPVFYPQLATVVPSTSKQNDYAWMAQLPQMREWLGARVIENLKTHSYTLANKTWEMSMGIPREDIEDDNLGIYSPISATYGEAAKKHPDSMFVDLLKDGEANLCWDGQYFFDTDHPVSKHDSGLGTYSNYSSTGMALTATNYEAVRALMLAYKGDNGLPLGIIPNLLVVPPALEVTAKRIVKMEVDAAGAGNPNAGTADVLMIPELAGENTTWYLLCTGRIIKPFVHQTRRPLSYVMKNQITDEVVLIENEIRMYSDKRDNAGYTCPFLAYKAVA